MCSAPGQYAMRMGEAGNQGLAIKARRYRSRQFLPALFQAQNHRQHPAGKWVAKPLLPKGPEVTLSVLAANSRPGVRPRNLKRFVVGGAKLLRHCSWS